MFDFFEAAKATATNYNRILKRGSNMKTTEPKLISVGFNHEPYIFKSQRELEIFMGERGYHKNDINWYEENPECVQPHGFHCSRLDLKGGEEPCEVCKAEAK